MNCTFQQAHFKSVTFIQCRFSGCWFDNAEFINVRFVECNVDESMRGATLSGVHFEKCDLRLDFYDAQLSSVCFSDLSLDDLEFASKRHDGLTLHNVVGAPVFRNLSESLCDLQAFRSAGWNPPRAAHNVAHRDEQLRQIDREFGDETEAWYQKWISGLIE